MVRAAEIARFEQRFPELRLGPEGFPPMPAEGNPSLPGTRPGVLL
jgi:hypothetical protein